MAVYCAQVFLHSWFYDRGGGFQIGDTISETSRVKMASVPPSPNGGRFIAEQRNC